VRGGFTEEELVFTGLGTVSDDPEEHCSAARNAPAGGRDTLDDVLIYVRSRFLRGDDEGISL